MESFQVLLLQDDPRAFLRTALGFQGRSDRKISLSEFSKKAGFSSRSFLSEYLSGKKKLSLESLNKVKGALRLPRPYKQYFTLLVMHDQPELGDKTVLDLRAEILRSKAALLRQQKVMSQISMPAAIIQKRPLFRLYAALGTAESGADFAEIHNKTNMNLESIRKNLQILSEQGLAEFRQGRFFARTSKVDFLNLQTSELSILAKDMCSEIQRESESIIQDPNSFIFYSAFSVRKNDLPKLKERLRDAIYSVLDDFQTDGGDAVHQIFLCSKL